MYRKPKEINIYEGQCESDASFFFRMLPHMSDSYISVILKHSTMGL